MRKVPAENFMATIAANVDNEKVSDEDFRDFIRNSLPIVEYKIQVGQPLEEESEEH